MKLHANAALSLKKRLLLARRVVDQGWTLTEAAAAAEVSERTAGKWSGRYRADGEARSSICPRPPCRGSWPGSDSGVGRVGLEPALRYERRQPGELLHIDVRSSVASRLAPAIG